MPQQILCGSAMPKSIDRAERPDFPSTGLSGATVLAIMPVFAVFYLLLVLPFIPSNDGERPENMLFWPIAAVLTLTLVFPELGPNRL